MGAADVSVESRVKALLFGFGSGILFVFGSQAAWAADSGCSACGDITFPEAAVFLAERGYPSEEFTVLMTWEEAVRGESGMIVRGFHISRKGTAGTADVYFDREGKELSEADLARLGIKNKNWDLAPVEQMPEMPPAVVKAVPAPPKVRSAGAKAGTIPCMHLEPVDEAALISEDLDGETADGRKARRVGVVRELPEVVAVTNGEDGGGVWTEQPDGSRLWAVSIDSPGARAMRIRFSELMLPSGAEVVVYNAANPAEAYGPYTQADERGEGFWSASCFADVVAVECFVPANAKGDVSIRIDEVVHTYAEFGALQWEKAAGSCNLDVSCYPEYEGISHSVAVYLFVSPPTQFYCTGALVADSDVGSSVPYFLTANHCVGAQDGSHGAGSMEFYWLYQTSECNGAVPAVSALPRTSGGADFLAGISSNIGSDFALVRLRNAPPASVTYAGWSSEHVAVGTNVACIHHPRGDYKRISFGHLTQSGSPLSEYRPVKPYSFFLESLWDEGTTEPTSSGSPLFRVDSQLIVGQLWGGYASCGSTDEPDYFGRFDRSFVVLKNWLDPDFVPVAPVAAFSGRPVSGVVPLEVDFEDASSPGGTTITIWAWEFGDGATGTGSEPTHVYTEPGIYSVTLTVTNEAGSDSIARTDYVTVLARPEASFTAVPASGVAPLYVQFTDTTDTGPFEVQGWYWEFGDGSTSTEQNPTHTFVEAGDYTVWMTITTKAGTDSDSKVVTVTNPLFSVMTEATLPDAVECEAYEVVLAAEGGVLPYRWGLAEGSNALPEGLVLPESGVLGGKPCRAGYYTFTVQVVDDKGSHVEREFSLNVRERAWGCQGANISTNPHFTVGEGSGIIMLLVVVLGLARSGVGMVPVKSGVPWR